MGCFGSSMYISCLQCLYINLHIWSPTQESENTQQIGDTFLSTRWWLCKHFHNKEDVTFIHFNLDNMKTFSVLTLSKHSKGKRKPKWTYLNSPTHNIPYFDEASWNSSPKVYPPMTIWLKKKTKWILEAFFLAVKNWLTRIDCFL